MTDGMLSTAETAAGRDGWEISESLGVRRAMLVAATISVGLLAWFFMVEWLDGWCGSVRIGERVVEERRLRVGDL